MSQKERVRKLATRLDRSPEAILARLARMGHGRYRSPEDMLPPEVVEQVCAAVRAEGGGRAGRPVPPAPEAGEGPAHRGKGSRPPGAAEGLAPEFQVRPEQWASRFSDAPFAKVLEGYLAARPTPAGGPAAPAPPASGGPPPPSVPPPQATEAALRDSLGAALVARRRAEEALEAVEAELARHRSALAEARARLGALEAGLAERVQAAVADAHARAEEAEREGDDLRARLESLQEAREQEGRVRARAEEQIKDAEARFYEAEARAAAARAREKAALARAEGGTSAEARVPARPKGLAEVLGERGLRDHDEVRAAMDALLIDARIETTMDALAVTDPQGFARALRQKTALTCGVCPAPSGRTAIEVSDPSRCEICGGSATRKAARDFVDACRRGRLQRLVVVGGSPAYFAELQQVIGGQLDARFVDGTVRTDRQRAKQQVEGSDLTLVWGATLLDHAVSTLYSSLGDPRVVLVAHRGIGGMLRRATRAVEARSGREEDSTI